MAQKKNVKPKNIWFIVQLSQKHSAEIIPNVQYCGKQNQIMLFLRICYMVKYIIGVVSDQLVVGQFHVVTKKVCTGILLKICIEFLNSRILNKANSLPHKNS